MVQGREARTALRVARGGAKEEPVSLAEEAAVRIALNGEAVATLTATPVALEELALGHLALAGRLRDASDVRSVEVGRARGGLHVVRVTGTARAPKPPQPRLPRGPRLAPRQVHALMKGLFEGAELYREGGGVHTSALTSPEGDALVAADVGKVNTLDRLAGMALVKRADTTGTILLTSGRLTGAMVQRALAMGCPLLVSHSGPTSAGLALAERRRATVVGYVRGGGFTVYCGAGRIARPRQRA